MRRNGDGRRSWSTAGGPAGPNQGPPVHREWNQPALRPQYRGFFETAAPHLSPDQSSGGDVTLTLPPAPRAIRPELREYSWRATAQLAQSAFGNGPRRHKVRISRGSRVLLSLREVLPLAEVPIFKAD